MACDERHLPLGDRRYGRPWRSPLRTAATGPRRASWLLGQRRWRPVLQVALMHPGRLRGQWNRCEGWSLGQIGRTSHEGEVTRAPWGTVGRWRCGAVGHAGRCRRCDDARNYQATLNPLNHSTASGSVSLQLNGSQATISEHVSGLAATFGASRTRTCSTFTSTAWACARRASADKNADGVVSTTEGAPQYGPIGTTLSLTGDTSPGGGYDADGGAERRAVSPTPARSPWTPRRWRR